MPASQKIITKLLERRQIEASFSNMLTAKSEQELRRQAAKIATLGPQVIPAIVGSLDRADAQMLAVIGLVSISLDHGEVTAALRQVVLQPQYTDRERLGAMIILQRFLGQPQDGDLLASLADPESMAISSLEEVLGLDQRNLAALIQYIEGLDQQEPDTVLAVIATLREMGNPPTGRAVRVVEPLRLMAQDVREEIAAKALQSLGAIRLPEAAQALQTLISISAVPLRPLAERMLRKLRFAGVKVSPLPPPHPQWRALISAVDGLGQQHVWFIQDNQQTEYARFLNVLLSDRAGAVEAVGHTQVPSLMLAPRRSLGTIHDITLPDSSGGMLMLEASFETGRRLVGRALAHNRETQIPIAGALRLLSPWLWGYSAPDSPSVQTLPKPSAEDQFLVGHLLDHPAFAAWTVRNRTILQAAEEAVRHPGWDLEVWIKRLSGELFADPYMANVFHRRLTAMGEWLSLADDEKACRLALAAAESMLQMDPQEQPFVQALVRRDLQLALHSLESRSELVLDRE